MNRYMEIDQSRFEVEVRVYDLSNSTVFIKHIHTVGTDNTVKSALEFCYERAHLYGVEEIRVGGAVAYAYIRDTSHTADPWFDNIKQIAVTKLW